MSTLKEQECLDFKMSKNNVKKAKKVEYEKCEICDTDIHDIMYINGNCFETEDSDKYMVTHDDTLVYACQKCIETHNLKL